MDKHSRSKRASVRLAVVAAALAASGCAAAAPSAPPSALASSGAVAPGTAASCVGLTRSQQFAAAKVVFDGVMLPGATAPGTNGALASPARMRVTSYLKGHGPTVATVQTAIELMSGGTMRVSEDGIRPPAGERWRIDTSSTTKPYATSICLGSHRLPARTAHFDAAGISFDYPAAWHARSYPIPPASFTRWIVWLSPQPMHPPCITHHGARNTTIDCTDPISHLDRDSILAYWTTDTELGGFHSGPGTPITVGGRRGIWRVQTGAGQAPNLSESEVITVIAARPGTRNGWDQLTALLRGPDTVLLVAQLKAMLRTVRWLSQ